MTKPTLGKDSAGNDVEINVQSFLANRGLIQAMSGGGKSWTIRRFVEQLAKDVQIIIIDPEGEFDTLRTEHDFVLAGKEGDIPADPKTAEVLVRRILKLGVSLICDLYELKAHERIVFVQKFIDALVNAPKNLWRPVLVIIDEAHIFAPEAGDSASKAVVIDLIQRGRKRGFSTLLATQRLAKLSKDVAAECGNRMIGRTQLDIDVRRAGAELGVDAAAQKAFRTLKAGEFFIFGPSFSTIGVEKVQVGTVKTAHTSGQVRAARAPAPTSVVKKALAEMADLAQEAEKELRDTEALKARVRELEKELRVARGPKKAAPVVDKAAVERARAEGYTAGVRDQLEAARARLATIKTLAKEFVAKLDDPTGAHIRRVVPLKPTVAAASRPVPKAVPARAGATSEEKLGACPEAILRVLLTDPTRAFARETVAVFSGYSVKSSTFQNGVSRLSVLGFLRKDGTKLQIAEEIEERARSIVGDVSIDVEGAHASLERSLGACPGAIFRLLRSEGGKMTRDEIAAATGYSTTSSTFQNAVSALNTRDLIEKDGAYIGLNPAVLSL